MNKIQLGIITALLLAPLLFRFGVFLGNKLSGVVAFLVVLGVTILLVVIHLFLGGG